MPPCLGLTEDNLQYNTKRDNCLGRLPRSDQVAGRMQEADTLINVKTIVYVDQPLHSGHRAHCCMHGIHQNLTIHKI